MDNIIGIDLSQLAWNLCIGYHVDNHRIILPSDIYVLFRCLIYIFTTILTYMHKISISDVMLLDYISFFESCFRPLNYSIHIFEYKSPDADFVINSRYSSITYDLESHKFINLLCRTIPDVSMLSQLYAIYVYNNSVFKICFNTIN
jgi:hypothetical protein